MLFEHLVCTPDKRVRHVDTERFCGFEIDHQLDLGDLLNWEVAGFLEGDLCLLLSDSELLPETTKHAICRCPRWEKAKVLSIPTDEKDEAGMVNHRVEFLRFLVLRVINFVRAGNRFDLLRCQ